MTGVSGLSPHGIRCCGSQGQTSGVMAYDGIALWVRPYARFHSMFFACVSVAALVWRASQAVMMHVASACNVSRAVAGRGNGSGAIL